MIPTIHDLITKECDDTLRAYSAKPGWIREHYEIEQTVMAGGYGYRQVLELVQNGADAILEEHEGDPTQKVGGRIQVVLRESHIYVANTGAPLSEDGVRALLNSHSSPKRGNQIGRFGLGFKSLLRLGGRIDVIGRTWGSFYFDPQRCRQELMDSFNVPEAPGLRLAWPLEAAAISGDSVLESLSWAETIVKAEIHAPGMVEHLREEIRGFPSEFLLFLPVQLSLQLDDGVEVSRDLRVELQGPDRLLHSGKEPSRWRVVTEEVHITDEAARRDATEVHAREKVPLAWAVQIEGAREEAGRFWAFFPTQTATFLAGILNAPWKLNSDRNAIIGGEWNKALMREAARIIADTMLTLCTDADPGRILDAFPRQDYKGEIAETAVDTLFEKLKTSAVIPDGTGLLRKPTDVWRHPRDSAQLARQWHPLSNDTELAHHVHPSCLQSRERLSRLNALAERLKPATPGEPNCPNLRKRETAAWFSSVASIDDARAVQVLKLAEAFAGDCTPLEWNPVRPILRIVPTFDSQLVVPSKAVFAPADVDIPDRSQVASALCDDAEAKRILVDLMKVKELGDDVWIDVLKGSLSQATQSGDWPTFWHKLRATPDSIRQQFVTLNKNHIRIRRRDGSWVSADAALLPGELVSSDDASDNQKVLVDSEMHGEDVLSLTALGVCGSPNGTIGPGAYDEVTGKSEGLREWLSHWRRNYQANVNSSASWGYLEPRRLTLPRGWLLLPLLTGSPNAKFSASMLASIGRGEFMATLNFKHVTVSSYPTIQVTHPLPWFVLKYGSLQVGEDVVSLSAVVARRHLSMMVKIPGWQDLLPALEKLAPESSGANPEFLSLWAAITKLLATSDALRDDSLRELWIAAAADGFVPESFSTADAEITLSQVFVTPSPDLAVRARSAQRIVVTLDEAALNVWLGRGARSLSDIVSQMHGGIAGPLDLLVSVVPELSEVLRPEACETALCQPVTTLRLVVGDTTESVPCLLWEGTMLLDSMQLAGLSRAERLRWLVNEAAAAGWLNCDAEEGVNRLYDAKVDERRAEVEGGVSLPEKLWIAVGRRAAPLHAALGELAAKEFIQQCESLKLAELALAQLGPATLSTLTATLRDEGLKPPLRWNSAEARAFVAAIGFPEEFAAAQESRREAEEYISGPIDLPPLHYFQKRVFVGIRRLLHSSTKRRRAVVNLPTGGGKTRVTVEAAVRLVLKPVSGQRSVIWIAQTDELCEQAVQAFRQVWLNIGARNTELRIVRFWHGTLNPSIQEPDKPVVVVATIQTLNSRMGSDELVWLQKPGLVVVDECHHAIAPSYTNLLRWLDAEAPRPGAPEKDEPPIIGLSATPFRMDDEASERLAKRFGQRQFPTGQERLHTRLREQGVLAAVEHSALESPAGLTEGEQSQLDAFPDFEGIAFDNLIEAINQRLAGHDERNQRLVERIQQAEERSILFFANSVQHAEEMSARLNLAGITAAAVSGNTPSVARRYFLDRFQKGEVRVLCNHSVLTTGFDAPKTDMVLIARQVFSPVRYMQMVGRGLRGEKNGGTAKCHIVTVRDNLGRFQGRHPFEFCQRYFQDV